MCPSLPAACSVSWPLRSTIDDRDQQLLDEENVSDRFEICPNDCVFVNIGKAIVVAHVVNVSSRYPRPVMLLRARCSEDRVVLIRVFGVREDRGTGLSPVFDVAASQSPVHAVVSGAPIFPRPGRAPAHVRRR
jgi:hypothetical protein